MSYTKASYLLFFPAFPRQFLITIMACIGLLAHYASYATEVKPMIGVYYFPGWYRAAKNPSGETSEWRSAIMKAAVPRPLCGFYNDADPRLWKYYITWMSSHGIDFIAFDWYYNAGQEFLYESLDRGFLQAKNAKDIKFCIHWCNHGGGWWLKPLDQTKSAILEMTDLLCARYFHRPNYLKINGCPVFMIYDIRQLLSFGGPDVLKDTLAAMRKRARENGFKGLYLVALYHGSSREYMSMLKEIGFDAFTAYTYSWMRPPCVVWNTEAVPYPDLAVMLSDCFYEQVKKDSIKAGIPYWPATFPGWDDRPRRGVENAFMNVGSTPKAFEIMFRGALKQINPASPVVMIEAWNEWGEGACIEPSKEHGFGFLKVLANVLGKRSPNESLPTAQEIESWSVLTPDELKVAKENELKPWPSKKPKLARRGRSFDVPEVKMPYIIDFATGGIAMEDVWFDNISAIERTPEGTLFEAKGIDPKIVLPEMRIPMHQIKHIAIEGKIISNTTNIEQRDMEIYWSTGLMPEFCGFASANVSWPTKGYPVVDVSEIVCWGKTGTPLLRLRIDPCANAGAGVRFLISKVIILGD
ncbi:MAG: glycoside hydrolase family 99-like domain-containing protein [Armatimonadetes bacterium]|nr:glycoside hydrolase family 99-like domain-containing protein [Armatimonadota bacterium]